MPQVTITNEIKCNVCKHEMEADVVYDSGKLLINVPDGWTAIAEEATDQDALVIFFYCEGHTPIWRNGQSAAGKSVERNT